jgi:hypothetical protein
MVGARAAAGTPCTERGPVNLRLGGAESERGLRSRPWFGFIGAGVGAGSGSQTCESRHNTFVRSLLCT